MYEPESSEEEIIYNRTAEIFLSYLRGSLDQFLFNQRVICSNVKEDMFLMKGLIWFVNFEWKFLKLLFETIFCSI